MRDELDDSEYMNGYRDGLRHNPHADLLRECRALLQNHEQFFMDLKNARHGPPVTLSFYDFKAKQVKSLLFRIKEALKDE